MLKSVNFSQNEDSSDELYPPFRAEHSEVENHEVLCEAKSIRNVIVQINSKISPPKEFLWNTTVEMTNYLTRINYIKICVIPTSVQSTRRQHQCNQSVRKEPRKSMNLFPSPLTSNTQRFL